MQFSAISRRRVLTLCEADYALDLTPDDEDHEDRSEPLDAEVEEALRLEC